MDKETGLIIELMLFVWRIAAGFVLGAAALVGFCLLLETLGI